MAGGLADRIGRVKILRIGIIFSIVGSLLIGLTPENAGVTSAILFGRAHRPGPLRRVHHALRAGR